MRLPHFIPILTAFTARVAGREMAELLQSPTALARALADTQSVIGHDGVLCLFDPGLIATACIGQQGGTQSAGIRASAEILQTPPITTLLESINPLRHLLPDNASIFTAIAGPALLFSQLQETLESGGDTCGLDPDYVVEVIRTVVRSALELKADGIALIEQAAPADPSEFLRCYKTVRKLADFYDAAFLTFRLPGAGPQQPELQAHCMFDLASEENNLGPLPGRLGSESESNVLPFTTAGDVPETTTVEELKTLLQELPRV
jgi:hypothetical protein